MRKWGAEEVSFKLNSRLSNYRKKNRVKTAISLIPIACILRFALVGFSGQFFFYWALSAVFIALIAIDISDFDFGRFLSSTEDFSVNIEEETPKTKVAIEEEAEDQSNLFFILSVISSFVFAFHPKGLLFFL